MTYVKHGPSSKNCPPSAWHSLLCPSSAHQAFLAAPEGKKQTKEAKVDGHSQGLTILTGAIGRLNETYKVGMAKADG